MTERAIEAATGQGRAPLVILAVGNPSRGDDALGPMLAEAITPKLPAGVKLIVDFQLQVEHALDIGDAERVLFIDAETGLDCDCHLRKVVAGGGTSVFSHALSPEQLLAVHAQICATPPAEAYVLGVAGQGFELGAGLSAAARRALETAHDLCVALLDDMQPTNWQRRSGRHAASMMMD